MALDLVYYGNDTLKKAAEEVKEIDGRVIKLVDAMFNTMYKARGIGLAAPQVDVSKRIIILDIEDISGPAMTIVNPKIKEFSKATEPYEEGCLSVPGIMHDIIRPLEILVAGYDLDGKGIEFEAGGLLARVIQHEIDHLDGILFIDRLDDYVRNEYRTELKKIKKLNRN